MPGVERRVKRGWMNLLVKRIIQETHDTRTLILVDEKSGSREFDYIPGQYLTFRFDHISEKPVVRSYTMSSAPVEGDFSAVTVKEVEDGFVSRYLCRDVKEGDVLRARGPIGKFCFDPGRDHKTLSMVAAGSGVTPFLSIMKEFAEKLGQEHAPHAMKLLVSFRSRQDIICQSQLTQLKQTKGITVRISLSRETDTTGEYWHGRIDEEMLFRSFGNCQGQTFMSCGPDAVMDLTKEFVLNQGVTEEHMKLESFQS